MDFEGKVLQIFPARSGVSKAGNPWVSQDVLFEVQSQSQFTRRMLVNFFNRDEEVKRLAEGAVYTVSIDIDAREYYGRWYNDVRAWRVQAGQNAQPQSPAADTQPVQPAQPVQPLSGGESAAAGASATVSEPVDDLPF